MGLFSISLFQGLYISCPIFSWVFGQVSRPRPTNTPPESKISFDLQFSESKYNASNNKIKFILLISLLYLYI